MNGKVTLKVFIINDDLNEEVEFNFHDGIDVEIDMDDVGQVVFNFPITDDEILKSIKSMKESESARLDNLPPGTSIHCIDIIGLLVKRSLTICLTWAIFRKRRVILYCRFT